MVPSVPLKTGGRLPAWLPSTLCPAAAPPAARWRDASRACASFSVAPPASATTSFAAVRPTTIPSLSLSPATTVYWKKSARAVPVATPPVSSAAFLVLSPISSPTDSAAPDAEASQVTSADQVTLTRICAPRPYVSAEPLESASIDGFDAISTIVTRGAAAAPVLFVTVRSAKVAASSPERSSSLAPLAGLV